MTTKKTEVKINPISTLLKGAIESVPETCNNPSTFVGNIEANVQLNATLPNVLVMGYCFALGRYLSANGAKLPAKGVKTKTPEFYVWMRKSSLALLSTYYFDKAQKARHVVKVEKGAVAKLPHLQADILDRMSELAPSGESENANRIHATIEALSAFSNEAFTAYYIKSIDNPSSLMIRASKELSEEAESAAKAKQEELLGSIELI